MSDQANDPIGPTPSEPFFHTPPPGFEPLGFTPFSGFPPPPPPAPAANRPQKKRPWWSRPVYWFLDLSLLKKILVIVGIIAIILGGSVITAHVLTTTETITVKDLGDQATNGGHKYMVFAEGEVFENTDSDLMFKYDSSDLQNLLEPGKSYKCQILGVRLPFTSSYRNLISCEPLG